MDTCEWSCMPDHIVVAILSYLPLVDRYHAALTCTSWHQCFQLPHLWRHFRFWFYMPGQSRYIHCVRKYGRHLKSAYIELDQSVAVNRANACAVIRELAQLTERRLEGLRIAFTGENPYFYAGQEFVDAIQELFGPVKTGTGLLSQMKDVDFSGLKVGFTDELFDSLAKNHPQLEKLNLQNRVLICRVSPFCILRLVQKCRCLRDLKLFSCSLSEEILRAFTEDDRTPLQNLWIMCRREEKYGKDISAATWRAVRRKLPGLKVALGFDHTCPLDKVVEVMKPEIHVTELYLETYIFVFDEVRYIVNTHYNESLEKMVLLTGMTRGTDELSDSVLDLAKRCPKLRALHIFSVLTKDTVDKILELHPKMKQNEAYTLKYQPDPHPWIAGNDC